MNIRNLKDSDGNIFSPKVSADSVYLSGSTENLTTKLSSIPTKTSQLTNDSGFATGTIPTKTSQLTNDSGFITSVSAHNHSASDITSGTLPASRGGTGQTSLEAACNALINSLSEGTSPAEGTDYYVAQWAGGGTSVTSYHRRPVSKIYDYIKNQAASSSTGFNNIYASGFYVKSSRKVKENIEPTKVSGEDMINSVSVVDFNYIDDETHAPKVGFIAEDTDPLFSTKERKAMDSANCIGILMKAVQELSSKVKNLTSELDKLTSKVGGGWNRVKQLTRFLGKTSSSQKSSQFELNNIYKFALPMNYRRVA